jgi:Uma2 family endonuclease
MGVRLAGDTQREPDVLVVTKDAYNFSATYFAPGDVLLAVEIESPDSLKRDRVEKPVEYAAAGIPHFWRVERDGEAAGVYVYQLNDKGTYSEDGVFHDRLTLQEPFPIDIPLAEIP